ncbi:MAG: acyl carrier protein [Woeseia sp.]|nr:acyl carrier protein [Gammaproteobacteria bacterium]NNE60244.1 acyl carrier protein [Woeseia sp.]NNL51116.1 acyl carrier protein [Woeseiaceae bacterium]
MNDDNTTNQIHGWLIGNFPLAKKRNVGVDESLLETGIIDSLGTLEVVLYLEEEFGVVVTDDEMVADHFESVRSIATFVDSKSRAASA